jgi:hypothetical protein
MKNYILILFALLFVTSCKEKRDATALKELMAAPQRAAFSLLSTKCPDHVPHNNLAQVA